MSLMLKKILIAINYIIYFPSSNSWNAGYINIAVKSECQQNAGQYKHALDGSPYWLMLYSTLGSRISPASKSSEMIQLRGLAPVGIPILELGHSYI